MQGAQVDPSSWFSLVGLLWSGGEEENEQVPLGRLRIKAGPCDGFSGRDRDPRRLLEVLPDTKNEVSESCRFDGPVG